MLLIVSPLLPSLFECDEERSATRTFAYLLGWKTEFECDEERSATIYEYFRRYHAHKFECDEERSATQLSLL